MSDNRRARRFVVNVPAVCESIGLPEVNLHPSLAKVYERVQANSVKVGQRFPAVVRDLSTNGAFITGNALPLLARVAIHFELKLIGAVDAIGWVLWRRDADCEIPGPDGQLVPLPGGFGLLFEAIPLETRQAIAMLGR